jgi:hypothetical protein
VYPIRIEGGAEMTAAILDFRPAAPPGSALPADTAADFLRLFALDRLPPVRRRLVCRWHRDADGRLASSWEPDIVLLPQR